MQKHSKKITLHTLTTKDFKETLNNKGGFIAAHWDGTNSTEEAIKKKQSNH